MRTHGMTLWVTLGDTLGDAQALNDLLGDTCRDIAQSLVDMLADSVPEMEELSVHDTWGCAEALSDAWADKVAEF